MKVETAAEQLLFATLRIETNSSVGTGFIVQHRWAENHQGLFLVTNKHVVQGGDRGRIAFTNRQGTDEPPSPALGQTTTVNIVGNAWMWTGHPSSDVDIAAMPLVPILNTLGSQGKIAFFRSIPTSLIPDQAALEELDVVEEVLFVGYPNGVYDRLNNLPIVRRGTTATPPGVNFEGKPIFLVDASVFLGSSGSPVFIYNRGAWTDRKGATHVRQRILFLGVLAAVLYRKEDGSLEFQEIPAAVRPVITTREMIDLGIVFKAHTVVETIEELLTQRGVLGTSTSAGS